MTGDAAWHAVQWSDVAGGAPAVTFATTEHFNLQTARALTVSEANGRASRSSIWRSLARPSNTGGARR
jgi:hypothetical protein